MPTATRRAPATTAAPPRAAQRVKIGDLGTYVGGLVPPPGDYALFFGVRIHQYTKKDGSKTNDMLGVMVTMYPLAGGDPLQHFYTMGQKAITAYAPDPDTPAHDGLSSTGLIAIPGAPSVNLSDQSNWGLMLHSLYDTGLVKGVFEDDFSVLDGVWVTTQNIPEPESRRSIKSKTQLPGQEQQQEDSTPKMVPVVLAIHEDGKPWENGGGLPEGSTPITEIAPANAPPAPAARPGPRPVPATAAKAAPKPPARSTKPAPEPEPEPAADTDGDVMTMAVEAVGGVFEKSPGGMTKALLRVNTFKAATALYGEAKANEIINGVFSSDAGVEGLVSQFGYTLAGQMVKPA